MKIKHPSPNLFVVYIFKYIKNNILIIYLKVGTVYANKIEKFKNYTNIEQIKNSLLSKS